MSRSSGSVSHAQHFRDFRGQARARPRIRPRTVLQMRIGEAARRATLARSVGLFRLFLREQTDPMLFYSAFADDSVAMLGAMVDLQGKIVLDVGGGPGYFARCFSEVGATYIGLEVDAQSDSAVETFSVRGSGTALPFRTASVDVAYCSNVLEHVNDAWRLADELVRVTRPGGTIFLSFTPWFSPWGGHETAPWHYLGGGFARRRFARKNGRQPKNNFGISLFGHRAGRALSWARRQPDARLVLALPRYHPWWAWWIVRVPIVREFATWNLVVVLERA